MHRPGITCKWLNAIFVLFHPLIQLLLQGVRDENIQQKHCVYGLQVSGHNLLFGSPTPVFTRLRMSFPKNQIHIKQNTAEQKKLLNGDLSSVIIGTSNQIRFVTTRKVINAIYTFLVGIQCKIWIRRAQIPYLETKKKEKEKSGSIISTITPKFRRKCMKTTRKCHVYLYGAIKRRTCKGVGVFWIKCHLHHIM